MSKIIPLIDKVLLKIRKLEEKTAGGIIIPKEKLERMEMAQLEAEVIALAEFAFADCETKPAVGDTVLIKKYAGLLYEMDGEEYRVVSPSEILGIKQ